PAPAEHLPALDAEMRPQLLDVVDQVPGGVLLERGGGRALPAAALVEQHHPVAPRVEEAPHVRRRAAAGAPVEEHDRFPIGMPALLVSDLVERRDAQPAGVVRLARRVCPGDGVAQRCGFLDLDPRVVAHLNITTRDENSRPPETMRAKYTPLA